MMRDTTDKLCSSYSSFDKTFFQTIKLDLPNTVFFELERSKLDRTMRGSYAYCFFFWSFEIPTSNPVFDTPTLV